MLSLPFPHRDRTGNYSITFLESVTLQLAYDSEREDYAHFKKFFESVTSLPLSKERYQTKRISSLRIKGDDGVASLKFAKNFVEYSINGQAYMGFESNYRDFLSKISSFLEAIKSNASEISIEKINIWPMSINEQVSDIQKLKDIIFSNELQEDIPCGDNMIAFKEYPDLDGSGSLLLKYGILTESTELSESKPSIRLILDTKCVKSNNISAADLFDNMCRINQTLYDAYHWAVTRNVIEAMKTTSN